MPGTFLALGEGDWDDWQDAERRGVRNQFRWSLQALACAWNDQLALFPDFTCKPYELASDYGNWSKAARLLFAELFSDDQLSTLRAIDLKIAAMSRIGAQFKEELWHDDALRKHPEWEELRALSKLALKSFDWPTEQPPGDRSSPG